MTELGAELRELLSGDQPVIAGYGPDELPPAAAGQLLIADSQPGNTAAPETSADSVDVAGAIRPDHEQMASWRHEPNISRGLQ